jgi:hypothetical protein
MSKVIFSVLLNSKKYVNTHAGIDRLISEVERTWKVFAVDEISSQFITDLV